MLIQRLTERERERERRRRRRDQRCMGILVANQWPLKLHGRLW